LIADKNVDNNNN